MNRCKQCKEFFYDEDVYVVRDDPSPSGIALPAGYYEYRSCPFCGADDYEEDFSLIDKIDMEEEDETSVIVSFEGASFQLYLNEDGELECLKIEKPKKAVSCENAKEVA